MLILIIVHTVVLVRPMLTLVALRRLRLTNTLFTIHRSSEALLFFRGFSLKLSRFVRRAAIYLVGLAKALFGGGDFCARHRV